MEPGVYHSMSNDAYHASEGISNSGLGDILQSPYHYYKRHLDPNRPERKELQSQEDGTLTHCAVLEPDEFHNRYVVGPEARRNSNAWKKFCAEHEGKTVIKSDQYTRAMLQRDAVWAIPDIAAALSKGRPEVSAYWIDSETGELCRCRPDFVHDAGSGDVLLDAKTYSDARPEHFIRQIARMNYHRQDPYYSDGYAQASGRPVLAFIFVAIEMDWPYSASATMLDPDSQEAGRRQYRDALNTYSECRTNNHWPGYPPSIEEMRLPHWKLEESQ